MDLELSPEQRTLREEIVRFAQNELNDDLIHRDADSSFSVEAWKRCSSVTTIEPVIFRFFRYLDGRIPVSL